MDKETEKEIIQAIKENVAWLDNGTVFSLPEGSIETIMAIIRIALTKQAAREEELKGHKDGEIYD